MMEYKRRLFHAISGVLLAFLIANDIVDIRTALILLVLTLVFSFMQKYIKCFHKICSELDRKKDMKTFPAKGSVLFLVGVVISMFLFQKEIAAASVIILGLGDATAPLIGKYGRISNPFDKKKKLEGNLAGAIVGALGAMFFVSPLEAFIAAFIAMGLEAVILRINDNILIPVVSGAVIWVIRMI